MKQEITISFIDYNTTKQIAMTIQGKRWLLLMVKRGIMITSFQKAIPQDYSIDTLVGPAFDIDKSLVSEQFIFWEEPGCAGIYVPEEQFTHVAELYNR